MGQKYYFEWLNDIKRILFPEICAGCHNSLHKQEDTICLTCLSKLPKTNYHRLGSNPILKRFEGRIPIDRATSFLIFRQGNVAQKLLHKLKYDGRKDIGEWMGMLFFKDLIKDGVPLPDIFIPLPLHPSKFNKRGYNQSHYIALGMEKASGIKIGTDVVSRTVANPTQTKKSRYERWENVEGIFKVNKFEMIIGKDVLLIDDVITTGSTLEACGRVILEAGAKSLSIATIASA